MSSFRARARKLAFGHAGDNTSETSSITSTTRSTSSQSPSRGVFRHSSSISEQFACEDLNQKSRSAYVKPRRTNRVRRVNRRQPFEHFVEALEHDGCVIVQDFINPQISQRVNDAEQLFTNSEDNLERQSRSLNIDVNSLIRESLLTDTLYQTLSRHFLTLETISWEDEQIQMKSNNPRVSSSTTRDLNLKVTSPTSPVFQRADSIYHTRHNATASYEYKSRRDVSIGLIVSELDSLSATVDIAMIPGSHLWDDQKPILSHGVKEIELRGGEALIMLGSLYHRIGDDGFDVETPRPHISRSSSASSGTRKEKLIHEIWTCSGIYRPAGEIENVDAEA